MQYPETFQEIVRAYHGPLEKYIGMVEFEMDVYNSDGLQGEVPGYYPILRGTRPRIAGARILESDDSSHMSDDVRREHYELSIMRATLGVMERIRRSAQGARQSLG